MKDIHFFNEFILNVIAPVAQLDRVLGFEPSCRRFESFRARHYKDTPLRAVSSVGRAGGF